ncbi:hypothetical protein [Filifactor villosus]|uniref:Uncharacterized protein n=1 Tax=Filifactor villosus TaxID=29374 RepID=A0ABV9QMV1_9FIRM
MTIIEAMKRFDVEKFAYYGKALFASELSEEEIVKKLKTPLPELVEKAVLMEVEE